MRQAKNRQWRLASHPIGLIKDSDYNWHEETVPDLKDGEVLVRNIYLSLDPANRATSMLFGGSQIRTCNLEFVL